VLPWHVHANPGFFLVLRGQHCNRSRHGDHDQSELSVVFHPWLFLRQFLGSLDVPPSPPDSLDAVLDSMGIGDAAVTWPNPGEEDVSAWLAGPQSIHWIGALYSNESMPHQCWRPHRVTADFDGVIFLRKVHAETVPEIGKHRVP
jgi:hypothetical protein